MKVFTVFQLKQSHDNCVTNRNKNIFIKNKNKRTFILASKIGIVESRVFRKPFLDLMLGWGVFLALKNISLCGKVLQNIFFIKIKKKLKNEIKRFIFYKNFIKKTKHRIKVTNKTKNKLSINY